MYKAFGRAITEVGFLIFLFYANMLMGQFTRSGLGWTNGLLWALTDIFTCVNFLIALVAGLIGYVVVEGLRKRL
jgi:hypothetical protein